MSNMPKFNSMEELYTYWLNELIPLPRVPVEELYRGAIWDGYLEVKRILEEVYTLDCYVLSAGLGLVKFGTPVPGYNSTFQPGSAEKPSKRIIGGGYKKDWWRQFKVEPLTKHTFMLLPISYAQMAAEFIVDTPGLLVTGWDGDLPSMLANKPRVNCTSDLSCGAAFRHVATSLQWAKQHVAEIKRQ